MSEADKSATDIQPVNTGTAFSQRKRRVLLAEDDLRSRYAFLDQFNKHGFEAELASNAAIALKKVAATRFDAIMLNLILPGSKELDLLKQIRAKDGLDKLPVFVCTSPVRLDAWRKRGAKVGVTKVFDKASTTPEAIIAQVTAHMSAVSSAVPEVPKAEASSEQFEESPMIAFDEIPAVAQFTNAGDKCPSERLRSAATAAMPAPRTATPAAPAPPPVPVTVSKSNINASQLEARLEELESANTRLTQTLAQITSDRDALVSLLRDRPIIGEPPPQDTEQLQKAVAAADQAQAAYRNEAIRSREFEQELIRLREARDELNSKLTTAAQTEAQSKQRAAELESRLRESSSELSRAKGELDKHDAERKALERALGDQLSSAKAAAEKAEAAYKKEAEASKKAAEELAALRKAGEDLNGKLLNEQQQAAESKRRSEEGEQRLRQSAAEVERLTADLKKQGSERGNLESALSRQLQAAKEAAQKAQRAHEEEAQRGKTFEKEMARLNRAREELNEKLLQQERAAAGSKGRSDELERRLTDSAEELQRVKSELEQSAAERSRVEAQLREQLAAAKAAAEEAQRQHKNETSFFTKSGEEIAALQKARDELNDKLEAEHEAAAESRRRSEELEAKLRDSAAEIMRMKAEMKKLVAEHSSNDRVSKELDEAKAAVEKAEKAHKKEADRGKRFQKELADLRKAHGDNPKFKQRIQQLEECVRLSTEDAKTAKAELDKQTAERRRLEAELRSSSAAKEPVNRPAVAQREQFSQTEVLVSEQHDAAHMDLRIREGISALARSTADLEKERAERRRVDQRMAFLSGQLQNLHEELRKQLEVDKNSQERIAQIEQELRERDDANTRLNAELQKEIAGRQLAEAQLRATGEMSSQLKQQFGLLDEAKEVFNRTQSGLEDRLKASNKALEEAQARLQKQTSERQRVQAALDEAQRKLQEQEQQNGMEISKLQSALQVESLERRRVETQAVQSRYASLDAARVGRAFVSSFRNQLRPPADTLMHSIRRLLDAALEQEQKKLVESVLENALVLQASLQDESTGQPSGAHEPEAQAN